MPTSVGGDSTSSSDAIPCDDNAESNSKSYDQGVAACPSEGESLPSSPASYDATPESMNDISWEDLHSSGYGDLTASTVTVPVASAAPAPATVPAAALDEGCGHPATPSSSGSGSEHRQLMPWLSPMACPSPTGGHAAQHLVQSQAFSQQFMAVVVPAGQWYAMSSPPMVSTPAVAGAALQTPVRAQARLPEERAGRLGAPKQVLTPLTPGLVTPASRMADEAGGGGAVCSRPPERRTTVMVRNVPNDVRRERFLRILDEEGLARLYDFVYLPVDFRTGASLGYAFVNTVDPAAARRLWRVLDGFARWNLPSRKRCSVGWSEPFQGLEENVERYRNSPVMHPSVPDWAKPVVFRDGVRVPFPEPSRPIRAPRARKHW